MARIRKSDIDEVRARTDIAEIVGDYVTLKSAGVGSLKGLCPFHDERTPSFHLRPALGHFHCFGCGESGDVYAFLQRMDHLGFVDAVERLAARLGYELHYEDGGHVPDGSRRLRLLQANAAAEQFFRSQLASAEAAAGQQFLGGRGFDAAAAEHFGVGYAPRSWDALSGHLKQQGFTEQELRDAGLVSVGERGSSYDRFRGRLVWPIRDTTGQTVGFGARKLYDDDQGPKYLNTPETAIYHKQQVLYGIDLAKRDIARRQQAVIVEGYTDVMAAHLAGVTTAVATCGTAFGAEHIPLLRRILDDETRAGRVVFTFDPDEAGQQAAMKAFAQVPRFQAQSFVAVGPQGLDPCDLRLARGDAAVRDLVERAVPMHEFVIRRQLAGFDLDTVEGRVSALRQAAPVVGAIRDRAMRSEYARQLARWLGMDLAMVERAVQQAGARREQAAAAVAPDEEPDAAAAMSAAIDPAGMALPAVRLRDLGADPVTKLEQQTLMAILQAPAAFDRELLDEVLASDFANPTLATVRDAVIATRAALGSHRWLARLTEEVPTGFAPLVSELAMAPLPAGPEEQRLAAYARALGVALVERSLLRRKAELLGSLQRTDSALDPDRYRELQRALVDVEAAKRRLRPE